MLCEKCKKNEARINLVKIVNGQKQEIWLCEECAKNISDIPLLNNISSEIDFPFQGLLTGVISNMSHASVEKEKREPEKKCPNCGLTYKEFKTSGKVGCAICYDVFSQEIERMLKTKTKDQDYSGKVPQKSEFEISQKRKLKNLKENLQKLISKEEYEEAAIVRDSIKTIENNIIESNLVKSVLIEGDEQDGELDS